jgi:hypothetical protein
MPDQKVGNVLNLFESFVKEAQAARVKSAERGSTTHPVMQADNHTIPVREGAKGQELRSDVREITGSAGVTGQSDASSAPENSTKAIGEMKPQASDTVAGNVPTPKGTKDAPGDKGPGDSKIGRAHV